MFTNEISSSAPGRFSRKAFEWVAPVLVKAAASPPSAASPDPAWQAYVGTYRSRWGDEKVLVLDGALVLVEPDEDEPLESKLVLVPTGGRTFRVAGAGFDRHGEQARFEVRADGRVTRLFIGDVYLTRVDDAPGPAGPSM